MNGKYSFVDLSRMLQLPRCAIHCETPEEAESLLYNAKGQFPEWVEGWGLDETNWGAYCEYTCYTLFYENSELLHNMTFCFTEYFEKNNYEIVDFSELSGLDLDDGGLPLEFLLGGE